MTDEPGVTAPPTCYRHPERETYVRCTRCERPICPDCMTSAAVGFQCPECIREGAATVREARTVAGGRITSSYGAVTKAIIGVTVGAWLVAVLVGDSTVENKLGMRGIEVAAGEYYRLLTVMLVHFGVSHILLNMLALWFVGPQLEEWLGRVRFLALYLVCGFAGGVASYAFGHPFVLAGGASGAIFGLFGALLVMSRRMHHDIRGQVWFIAILLVLPFITGGSVDWRGHVGGLVAGLALGAVFAYAPRGRQREAAVVGVLAVVLVCCALTAWRTQQLRDDPVYGPYVEQVQRTTSG